MLVVVFGAVWLSGRPALAHQASITHSTITVSEDRQRVDYRILFDPADTAEILGLPPDRDPSDERIARRGGDLVTHVLARVVVKSGAVACPVEPGGARSITDGGRFVEVTWAAHCPAPIETLVIDYDLFFDIDPLHTAMLRVDSGRGDPAVATLRDGFARFTWELGTPPPSSFWGFLRSGVEHIAFGFDHVAFLLALLLVVAIRRLPDGSWALRDIGDGIRATAIIVTAFTIAHSITLIAASLGAMSVPSKLVESAIAASIVYVAVEDILRPHAGHRYLVTFVFGLIHGLGFASMLEVMLPPEHVLVPLLAFNLGVELGQLAIVIVALPLLHLAARAAGPHRYRTTILPGLAGLLALAGAAWLITRLAG